MDSHWSNGDEDAVRKAAEDQEVLMPDWTDGGRVHNWRNYVGPNTRRIWWSFTSEQKAALAVDADTRAGDEEWE